MVESCSLPGALWNRTCALLTTQPRVALPTASSLTSCFSISCRSHWWYLKILCFTSGYNICLVCLRVIKVSRYSCISSFCISFSTSQCCSPSWVTDNIDPILYSYCEDWNTNSYVTFSLGHFHWTFILHREKQDIRKLRVSNYLLAIAHNRELMSY